MKLRGWMCLLGLICTSLQAAEFTEKEAAALVERLGSDEFKVRKAASEQLQKLALENPDAEKLFEPHLNHPDPEVRVRLQEGLIRISTQAKWWPPTLEGRIRSPQDENPRLLRMTNRWNQPVRIFWLDYEGKRKPWSETVVQPGDTRICHQTYEGHAWLFTDKAGKALGIYTLGPKTKAFQFAGPVK